MNVLPERKKQYRAFLHKNIESLFMEKQSGKDTMPASYILAIMLAAERVGEALDAGATPEQATEEMIDLGLTGYMAGMAAYIVAVFHPSGEAFKIWWNERYGLKKREAEKHE